MKKELITALILFSLVSAGAESIRGNTVKLVDMSRTVDTESAVGLGIEQFLAVDAGDAVGYLEGFELSVKIPAPLQQYADSFILMYYGEVSPFPEEESTRNYQGVEIGHKILSSRARQYLNFTIGNDGGSDSIALSADDFPLVFMLLPMSKGVPDAIHANPFEMTITPRWKNIGAVILETEIDSFGGGDLEVWIDDEKVNYTGQELILSAGIHQLLARLEGYDELSFSFITKQGKLNRVELPFRPLSSSVKLSAPESCVIYLDGEKIDFPLESEVEVEKGDHSILFKLGDYQISRRFSIISGKDYEISLFLDILVEEN